MRFATRLLLEFVISFTLIRSARDKEGQECSDQNGVIAIEAETVKVPPGFVVYIENNVTLAISSGIGDEVKFTLCVNAIFKQGLIERLVCTNKIEDVFRNGTRHALLKDAKSGKWMLQVFNLTATGEEITYVWWDNDSKTKLGQNTIIVRERRSPNITVISRVHSNISVVTYIPCEEAVDVAFRNGDIHHFDFALKHGKIMNCNVYTDTLSFQFHYLSINFWNITGDSVGMHTLSVAQCTNFTSLSVEFKKYEGSEKETTKTGDESTADVDKETIWCSCNNKTHLLLPLDVELVKEGKAVYHVKSNGSSLIWSANHSDTEDSVVYVCKLPKNCVYPANKLPCSTEMTGTNFTDNTTCSNDGDGSTTVPWWAIPVSVIPTAVATCTITICIIRFFENRKKRRLKQSKSADTGAKDINLQQIGQGTPPPEPSENGEGEDHRPPPDPAAETLLDHGSSA